MENSLAQNFKCGLGGLVVSAINVQMEGYVFISCLGQENFQTIGISTTSSYLMSPGLSIKWTGWHLVTNSSPKCVWVIHESKAVQTHVHNTYICHCLMYLRGLEVLKIWAQLFKANDVVS